MKILYLILILVIYSKKLHMAPAAAPAVTGPQPTQPTKPPTPSSPATSDNTAPTQAQLQAANPKTTIWQRLLGPLDSTFIVLNLLILIN
ncbi:hypothetical protein pb186bvf_015795 [Paramecium bursaria]